MAATRPPGPSKPPVSQQAPGVRPGPPKPPPRRRYEVLFDICRPCRMTKFKNQTHRALKGDTVVFIQQTYTPEGDPCYFIVRHEVTGEEIKLLPNCLKQI